MSKETWRELTIGTINAQAGNLSLSRRTAYSAFSAGCTAPISPFWSRMEK